MGNVKTVVPILLSLAIAIAGTWGIYQWMQGQRVPAQVVQVQQAEAVPVVVAAVDIDWGTKLKPEMLKTLPYLSQSLPKGHFTKLEDVNGRVIIAPLKANDAVAEHKLAPVSVETGGVAAVLKPGKRAVAVKGDKVIGLSGLVNPGNRVDVLVTVEESRATNKESKTKLVLENIFILATGTQIQKNEKGEPAPVDVYTLEVTPEESEKLALAATEGKIQLALRSITDVDSVITEGITVPKLLTSLSRVEPPRPVAAPQPAAAQPTVKKWTPRPAASVEVIKGSAVSHKTFAP